MPKSRGNQERRKKVELMFKHLPVTKGIKSSSWITQTTEIMMMMCLFTWVAVKECLEL